MSGRFPSTDVPLEIEVGYTLIVPDRKQREAADVELRGDVELNGDIELGGETERPMTTGDFAKTDAVRGA